MSEKDSVVSIPCTVHPWENAQFPLQLGPHPSRVGSFFLLGTTHQCQVTARDLLLRRVGGHPVYRVCFPWVSRAGALLP